MFRRAHNLLALNRQFRKLFNALAKKVKNLLITKKWRKRIWYLLMKF